MATGHRGDGGMINSLPTPAPITAPERELRASAQGRFPRSRTL